MKYKTIKMEDALECIIDYRGKTPKKSEIGIMTLSAKSVRDGYIDYSQCYYISDEEYKRFMVRGFPHKGDVLLTTEAPLGVVAVLDRDDIAIAQRLLTLRGKKEILDTDFLYYYLRSPIGQAKLHEKESGTTVTGIKQSEFRKIEIDIPDVETQKKIASVLKIIDQKIKNNFEINNNLLQQLQIIFHKMIPYQPSDTLPSGWKCTTLGSVCESISIKHSFDKPELIFLNTGDIEEGKFLHANYSSVDGMPGQAKKSIKKDDILYSEIRPINHHFAYVNFAADDYVVSTKLMVIRATGISSRRLYHYLTSQEVITELQHEAEIRSGTFPQIRFENIQRLPIVVAPQEVESKLSDILNSYYTTIDNNMAENIALANIRDALLPKLMSGELDVYNLEV